jgi:hypothetical protein
LQNVGVLPLTTLVSLLYGASGDAGPGSREPSRKMRLGPSGFDPSRKIAEQPFG